MTPQKAKELAEDHQMLTRFVAPRRPDDEEAGPNHRSLGHVMTAAEERIMSRNLDLLKRVNVTCTPHAVCIATPVDLCSTTGLKGRRRRWRDLGSEAS